MIDLKGLFKTGAEKLVKTTGEVLDNLLTSKEEKEAAKLAIQQEINRHTESMEAQAVKMYELEVNDRSSARSREAEFVKATGHMDYLMWFLVISAMIIFAFMVWAVITGEVPENNRELIFHIFGLVEGAMLTNIFNYYFGSSAGSRIKDMKGKN